MRFFSSELGHNYGNLTFGYANYGLLESGDKPLALYERGYLPYSGSPESKRLFYMARSGRLYLPEFELNSECRRVAKKFDGQFSRKLVPFGNFEVTDEFVEFWLEYFNRAHGPKVMPRERLMHILNFGIITHVGVYKNTGGKIAGYTLEIQDEVMTHDWYQSYAPELDKSSFGVWLLIDIAREAKARGAEYYYPGTVYAENIYKANFPALEYWSGEKWVKDTTNRALKARTSTDASRQTPLLDEWKQNHPLF